MANRSHHIPFILTCFCLLLYQVVTGCNSNSNTSVPEHNNDSAKTVTLPADTIAQKHAAATDQQELDEFVGAYTSVCKGDKNIYLTLDITKSGAEYNVVLKSFPGNYTLVTGPLKPDNTNFDPQLDVWAITDKKNYTYGFVFNKKYLAELFSGCLVLDNVDYKPTINKCFIADKQDNIVFCKIKKK